MARVEDKYIVSKGNQWLKQVRRDLLPLPMSYGFSTSTYDAKQFKTRKEAKTLAVLFGVGVYFADRAKYKAGKKNRHEEAAEERQKAAYKEELRTVIKEENKPLEDKIEKLNKNVDEMKANLQENTEGTVTLLRNDMKKSLDYCKRQGYASASDRAN